MLHSLMAEFLGTALMILFGVGVHCDEVLAKTKYHGSGHIFAITTWAFGISVTLFIFGGVCIMSGNSWHDSLEQLYSLLYC